MIKFQCPPTPEDINYSLIAVWLEQCAKAKKILQNILHPTKLVRTEEWKNAKNHYIRIGKYGNIARKTETPKLGRDQAPATSTPHALMNQSGELLMTLRGRRLPSLLILHG
jgi:hypothetical protein